MHGVVVGSVFGKRAVCGILLMLTLGFENARLGLAATGPQVRAVFQPRSRHAHARYADDPGSKLANRTMFVHIHKSGGSSVGSLLVITAGFFEGVSGLLT
jgi:hypothetical protein